MKLASKKSIQGKFIPIFNSFGYDLLIYVKKGKIGMKYVRKVWTAGTSYYYNSGKSDQFQNIFFIQVLTIESSIETNFKSIGPSL